MFQRKINGFSLIVLIAIIIMTFSACAKLNVNRLKANHYFSKANHNFSEQKYRLAIEDYEKALIYNPDLVQAYRFLGESYKSLYKPGVDNEQNNERAQKALDALKKALGIEPNNKQIIHSLGDMYDKLQDFDEAEKLFLKIVEMEPTNMNNYYVVAEFYKRYAGQTEEEEGAESAAAGKTPFQKAKEMYLRRIETDPENAQGYDYVAQFYEGLSPIPDFDTAHQFHRYSLALNPGSAVKLYTIGVNRFMKAYRLQKALSREERIKLADQSEEALKKAIETDPSYPDSYAFMNMLYRNIHSQLYPERESRFIEDADRYGEQFREIRKRILERERLERELQRETNH